MVDDPGPGMASGRVTPGQEQVPLDSRSMAPERRQQLQHAVVVAVAFTGQVPYDEGGEVQVAHDRCIRVAAHHLRHDGRCPRTDSRNRPQAPLQLGGVVRHRLQTVGDRGDRGEELRPATIDTDRVQLVIGHSTQGLGLGRDDELERTGAATPYRSTMRRCAATASAVVTRWPKMAGTAASSTLRPTRVPEAVEPARQRRQHLVVGSIRLRVVVDTQQRRPRGLQRPRPRSPRLGLDPPVGKAEPHRDRSIRRPPAEVDPVRAHAHRRVTTPGLPQPERRPEGQTLRSLDDDLTIGGGQSSFNATALGVTFILGTNSTSSSTLPSEPSEARNSDRQEPHGP